MGPWLGMGSRACKPMVAIGLRITINVLTLAKRIIGLLPGSLALVADAMQWRIDIILTGVTVVGVSLSDRSSDPPPPAVRQDRVASDMGLMGRPGSINGLARAWTSCRHALAYGPAFQVNAHSGRHVRAGDDATCRSPSRGNQAAAPRPGQARAPLDALFHGCGHAAERAATAAPSAQDPLVSAGKRESRFGKRAVNMPHLFWLTDAQMARLEPCFPKSHGKPFPKGFVQLPWDAFVRCACRVRPAQLKRTVAPVMRGDPK